MADDTSFQELIDLSRKRREKWTSSSLQRQTERPAQLHLVTTFPDTQAPIVLSPDGTHVTSGSPDFTLRIMPITGGATQQLAGARRGLRCAAWSSDSALVAAGSRDSNIYVWNWRNREALKPLQGHHGAVHALAWSQREVKLLASGGDDGMRLWDVPTGTLTRVLDNNSVTRCIAWSRDGHFLAAAGDAGLVWVWDAQTGQVTHKLEGYRQPVRALAWSPDGRYLVSAGDDAVIHIWDTTTSRDINRLEGHTNTIIGLTFSADGTLLVSQSRDAGAEVRFWRTDSWDYVAALPVNPFEGTLPLGFQTGAPRLLTGGDVENEVRLWDVDIPALAQARPPETKYTNAKVVLVGDTGVGKSGLRIVLMNQPFEPTLSTHGRFVLRFAEQVITVTAPYVHKEQREIFLWDLAGQPRYRLIHQLHLNEVILALIVFDNRSDVDPFTGVPYWSQVLMQIQQRQGNHPLKKFLVAARTDRGGIGVEPKRIARVQEELGLDDYFETSAMNGKGIDELRQAIKDAIDWDALPRMTSTRDFQQIQDFLRREKARKAQASEATMPVNGVILSREDDLYRLFVATVRGGHETETLRAEFNRCIDLIENQGEIQRLSFGNFILLYPELLDGYASALINAAAEDPSRLGSIPEDDVRAGRFDIPAEVKIKDAVQESFLLLAMIEMLIQHELVFREPSTNYLVFPTQATSERDDLPDPQGKTVVFTFSGPLMSIYATLVTRLEHTKMFHMTGRWKNAVEYRSDGPGTFGIFLEPLSESQGRLTIFCNDGASEEMQLHFEQFIHAHLNSQALFSSIDRYRIFTCPHCHQFTPDPAAVRERWARGFNQVNCMVCDKKYDVLDGVNRLSRPATAKDITSELIKEFTAERKKEEWRLTLEGKKKAEDYDVFISYDRRDQDAVLDIARQLEKRGIHPWLDRWDIRPGYSQQAELESGIRKSKSGAVFIGVANGVSDGWQRIEYEALMQQVRERGEIVFPVILPSCIGNPNLRLLGTAWVDFREHDPDPFDKLVWAITGERPESEH